MTARELYNEYAAFCSPSTYKAMSFIKFTTKLKEINIEFKKINGLYKYKVSYAELEAIAKKNKWMHELDEYKYPANYVFPDENANDVLQPIEDKDMKIAELLAEIKKLKALLQAKDNDLDYVAKEPVVVPEVVKPVVKATVAKKKVKKDKSIADIILSFN